MGLFDERIPYKPFEYPEYFDEAWMKQCQSFWIHSEIPMQSDVKDWKENLSEAEKHLVGNILLGFAQTETQVGGYWSRLVPQWFPKPEIKQMALAFAFFETIHAVAYSYLNETLGLDDFDAFLHEPTLSARFDLLAGTKNDYTHEDLKKNPEARKDVARSLAVFSAFAEGVALYSSFAVLYSFQMRNMLKGIGQQMKFSIRDESTHSIYGIKLFNHMCSEYKDLRESVQSEIIQAANVILELEHNFIDKMFELGDLPNLSAKDLKEYMSFRTNHKLIELGYQPIFKFNQKSVDKLDWFEHLAAGVTQTDFFMNRVTDYSKNSQNEDWENIF